MSHRCCQSKPYQIIGIDEVGRGSLIGEVTAAAVLFTRPLPEGLRDSKKLSAKKRSELDLHIRDTAIVSIGSASIEEIDEHNIHGATMLAMARAYHGLPMAAREGIGVLIDGDSIPDIQCDRRIVSTLVNADNLCPTVSAASIVAKVHRDRIIMRLADMDGRYGWDSNKGYGTRQHRNAIEQLGVSDYHRRSFEPVKTLLRETRRSQAR